MVEGRRIVLDEKERDVDDFTPQIMIFANGDLSSFEISLQREGGGASARIYTDEQTGSPPAAARRSRTERRRRCARRQRP